MPLPDYLPRHKVLALQNVGIVDANGNVIEQDVSGQFLTTLQNIGLVDEEGNIVVDEQPFLDDEGKPVGGEEGKDMEGKTKKRRGRPKKTETA